MQLHTISYWNHLDYLNCEWNEQEIQVHFEK